MLTVENINLHYGAAQALRGVSLKAEMGKITCVLGRNGVGKSSLLRAVTGQQATSAGTIRFGDAALDGLAPYQRAKRGVGYVPQGREIFPLLSVQENLESGYAPLRVGSVSSRTIFSACFQCCKPCCRGAAAISRAASSSSLRLAGRW